MKTLLARTIGVLTIMLLGGSPSPVEAASADECIGQTGCFSCTDAEPGCITVVCNGKVSLFCLEP